MRKILVIEDAPEYRELLTVLFAGDGFEVESAENAEDGVALAKSFAPDVVILDIGLQGVDGIEVCRRIRTFSDTYVIMLTARDEEIDRLVGLTAGADDYVTKPFFPRELAARVQAVLRRPRGGAAVAGASTSVRVFGDLAIDPQARIVTLAAVELELTKIEYELLDALTENPRLSLSRQQLLDRVWGDNWFGDDHVVDVHVSNLRKKLGEDPKNPRFVRTVRGFGYRLGDGASA